MRASMIDGQTNTRNMTNVFQGYNHNPVIADGEIYDSKNMSTDYFPLLAPRSIRKKLEYIEVEGDLLSPTMHEINVIRQIDAKSVELESISRFKTENSAIKVTGSEPLSGDYVKGQLISFTVFLVMKEKTPSGMITMVKSPIASSTTEYELVARSNSMPKAEYIEVVERCISAFPYADINIAARELVAPKIHGILLKDEKVAYITDRYFSYDNQMYSIEEYGTPDDSVKLVNFGTEILIFPLNITFNTIDKSIKKLTKSAILAAMIPGGAYTCEYFLCDYNGNAINATVSDTAPTQPKNKDYWVDTSGTEDGLYQYSDALSMWVGIATSYICIKSDGLKPNPFSEGDAVFITDCSVPDIANGSVIQKAGDGFVVVIGILRSKVTETNEPVMQTKIPELDHVCVSNNRVWGCHYGEHEGKIVNEIYASKLGDPANWYTYEGIATDSYALSLGDDGEFTGAITYNGYPIFFKENVIYKMYGTYPQAYQLYTYDCRGCQKGSSDSIVILSEYILYKSRKDICVFNGETPTGISEVLGLDRYDNASAGVSVSKYYISMRNKTTNEYEMFVYDMDKGLWMKEDDLHIQHFAYNKSGLLYGHDENVIYAFEFDEDGASYVESEDYVEWEAITGTYNYETPDRQYLSRLTIRAQIAIDSELTVAISYDDKPFEEIKTLRGKGDVATQSVAFACDRCDHYRLKLSGHGMTKIYSISRSFNYGGEKNGTN